MTVRWNGLDALPPDAGPAVVVLGVFDGVHLGHRAVLAAAVQRAHAAGLPCIALTFVPHPREVVGPPGTRVPLLSTPEHRQLLMAECGVDALLVLDFTPEFARWSAQSFVDDLLVGRLRARVVVAGENFAFGHKRSGNVALLRELGPSRGFEVETVGMVLGGEQPWSSTAARGLIADGDVAGAAQVLGRAPRVEGAVVHGDRRGRELGFPTANLGGVERFALPADGVYAGWLVRDPYGPAPQRLPAAISVGTNPTFDGVERRVEAYVLDRDDLELYGEHVAVDFVGRLRGQLRFADVGELVSAMSDDVASTRRVLGLAGADSRP